MHYNLPACQFQIMRSADGDKIFDRLRKKFVALTPEEWVRQNFVNYLVEYKGFPVSLMANEVSITLNNTRRRCDTVVYSKMAEPLVIIEYKASSVEITQQVFDQIVRYNMVLRAQYLIVSNGLNHYCCSIDYDNNSYKFIKDIPNYDALME